jgi:uncharacterized integral membrane protein
MSTQQRPGTNEGPQKERAYLSKTIAAVAVAILLLAFGLSNRHDVRIDWLVTTTQTSLIVVIIISAVLGAILGALAVRGRSRKAKARRGPAQG